MLEQRFTRRGEPARRGRSADAIDVSQGIDAHALNEMKAQDRPIFVIQLGQCSDQRRRHRAAVFPSHEVELRIGDGEGSAGPKRFAIAIAPGFETLSAVRAAAVASHVLNFARPR